MQQRQAEKLTRATSSATTFEAVSREFHDTKAAEWSEQYAEQWIERMQRDLFPTLGALPLRDILSPALLGALRLVEARGAIDSAHTLRQQAGQVFRFGIATGRCSSDPAASLKGALKSVIVTNMAAITDPAGVATLMRAIDDYRGHPVTRGALVLSALTFQRPGNVRAMEWAEIDTDAALWTIPADKMKRKLHGKENGRPHMVPLAQQALAVLAALRPLTSHGRFVFPSLLTGERCMSDNTINTALRRIGYTNDEMTAHGFRAMARTILDERLGVNPEAIEAQLAHGKSGPLGAAYDRAEFMEQRRQMMSAWADFLDTLRSGAKVIPIRVA